MEEFNLDSKAECELLSCSRESSSESFLCSLHAVLWCICSSCTGACVVMVTVAMTLCTLCAQSVSLRPVTWRCTLVSLSQSSSLLSSSSSSSVYSDDEFHSSLVSHWWDLLNPLTPTAAIKHPPVPDRVKPSFVIFDIRALWRSALSVRVPGCQKIQKWRLNPVWHRMLYSCCTHKRQQWAPNSAIVSMSFTRVHTAIVVVRYDCSGDVRLLTKQNNWWMIDRADAHCQWSWVWS